MSEKKARRITVNPFEDKKRDMELDFAWQQQSSVDEVEAIDKAIPAITNLIQEMQNTVTRNELRRVLTCLQNNRVKCAINSQTPAPSSYAVFKAVMASFVERNPQVPKVIATELPSAGECLKLASMLPNETDFLVNLHSCLQAFDPKLYATLTEEDPKNDASMKGGELMKERNGPTNGPMMERNGPMMERNGPTNGPMMERSGSSKEKRGSMMERSGSSREKRQLKERNVPERNEPLLQRIGQTSDTDSKEDHKPTSPDHTVCNSPITHHSISTEEPPALVLKKPKVDLRTKNMEIYGKKIMYTMGKILPAKAIFRVPYDHKDFRFDGVVAGVHLMQAPTGPYLDFSFLFDGRKMGFVEFRSCIMNRQLENKYSSKDHLVSLETQLLNLRLWDAKNTKWIPFAAVFPPGVIAFSDAKAIEKFLKQYESPSF